MNLILVYAPTAESTEAELEPFYEILKQALIYLENDTPKILKAKVRRGEENDIESKFRLGTRNEQGEILMQFCRAMQFAIINSWCKLPPRRIYRWKSPAYNNNNTTIIRYQIDYIITQKRFRNAQIRKNLS